MAEYVLVGQLGEDPKACYALSYEHEPYTRVLLEEVSKHLLHIGDACSSSSSPRHDRGSVCAVAYRR